MIVQWFAEMFFKVITSLLNWVNLPNLDSNIVDTLNVYILGFLEAGVSMIQFFIPSNIYKICIPIVLFITAFKYGYFFVMWILKKIPMAGVQ